MLSGKLLGEADWLYGSLGRTCALPSSMERLKSRLSSTHFLQGSKFGNIFLHRKLFAFSCSRNWAGRPAVMRNPGGRQRPILGDVLPPDSF